MHSRELSVFMLIGAIFIAALVTANIVASKIINLWGVFVPAGVLAYSITFATTDSLAEIWGRAKAQAVVNAGVVVLLLVWGLIALAVQLPPAPFWEHQQAFAQVLQGTYRVIGASIIAYIISQSFDVWIFHKIRQYCAARHLWLRNTLSTLLSQTLDTCLFVSIAFYGQFPLLPLIGGQLSIKIIIAILDTPVVYALVYLVRRHLGAEVVGEAIGTENK